MNFIQRLQEENKILQITIENTQEEIKELLEYLASDKFTGIENNYVNAKEMYQRIVELRNTLTV